MSLQQEKVMTEQEIPNSVSILGVRVDCVGQDAALAAIEGMIARRRGSNNEAVCQQVVTVNAEFVMAAQKNEAFRIAINSAALSLADGIGVVLATRYLGRPVPERVTGTDILPVLAQRCAAAGYRMYLLGAAPGVAEAAAERLRQLAPGVIIAGTYAGSPAEDEEEAILERVRRAEADVLCVAYGAPEQDLWIWRNRKRLPVAVAMGVGGAFDFLSGRQRRAPQWMRKMGLEWLYRLYREPWRWRRMLALPRFAVRVLIHGRTRSERRDRGKWG